jgi:hypothetical protein
LRTACEMNALQCTYQAPQRCGQSSPVSKAVGDVLLKHYSLSSLNAANGAAAPEVHCHAQYSHPVAGSGVHHCNLMVHSSTYMRTTGNCCKLAHTHLVVISVCCCCVVLRQLVQSPKMPRSKRCMQHAHLRSSWQEHSDAEPNAHSLLFLLGICPDSWFQSSSSSASTPMSSNTSASFLSMFSLTEPLFVGRSDTSCTAVFLAARNTSASMHY